MARGRKLWNMKGCSKRVMRGGCEQCLGGGSKGQMGGRKTRRRRRGGCGSICAAAAPLLLLGGKKSCGCNKIPFFNGGKQHGGNASAFVGAPITATTPGNHYALNPEVNNPNDPSVIMANRDNSFVPSHSAFSIKGGRRRRRRRMTKKNKQSGGFNLIPQDITNMFRGLQFNAGSSYNAMQGYRQPMNPLPYKDQMSKSFGKQY